MNMDKTEIWTLRASLWLHRYEAGLTQAELARRVCVARETISRIERGRLVPSVLLALRIAEVLNTDVGKLFWIERQVLRRTPFMHEDSRQPGRLAKRRPVRVRRYTSSRLQNRAILP
jgi:putative transcriptional regulator